MSVCRVNEARRLCQCRAIHIYIYVPRFEGPSKQIEGLPFRRLLDFSSLSNETKTNCMSPRGSSDEHSKIFKGAVHVFSRAIQSGHNH